MGSARWLITQVTGCTGPHSPVCTWYFYLSFGMTEPVLGTVTCRCALWPLVKCRVARMALTGHTLGLWTDGSRTAIRRGDWWVLSISLVFLCSVVPRPKGFHQVRSGGREARTHFAAHRT